MTFSQQEHWSRLPFPPSGELPDPGIEPMSLVSPALQADSLPIEPWGKPQSSNYNYNDYKIKYADNEEKEKILAEK